MKVLISTSASVKIEHKKYSWFKAKKPIKINSKNKKISLKKGDVFGVRNVRDRLFYMESSDLTKHYEITERDYLDLLGDAEPTNFTAGKPKLKPSNFAKFMQDRSTYKVPLKQLVQEFYMIKRKKSGKPYYILVTPDISVPEATLTDQLAATYFETTAEEVASFLEKKGIKTVTFRKAQKMNLL